MYHNDKALLATAESNVYSTLVVIEPDLRIMPTKRKDYSTPLTTLGCVDCTHAILSKQVLQLQFLPEVAGENAILRAMLLTHIGYNGCFGRTAPILLWQSSSARPHNHVQVRDCTLDTLAVAVDHRLRLESHRWSSRSPRVESFQVQRGLRPA